MSKKIVLVTGATGKQGGSLVDALLAHGGYSIRALSRTVDSVSAAALASRGVEVLPGDLSDKDSLMKACKGVYAAFGVSIPEFFSGIDEEVQGRNLVDACHANEVAILVWSSLPGVKETSGGRYTTVTAFDAKAEVEKYIKTVGQPAIVFRTGGFTSNSRTNVAAPVFFTSDVGPVVLAAIEKWDDPAWHDELTKSPIPLVSYQITGEEAAAIISKVAGKQVDCITVFSDQLPLPLKEMNQWCNERLWGYGEHIPVDLLVKLGVKFHTLDDYAREELIPWMKSQE
ncbi:NADP-binding protein [Dacryopinax primogenitus]|uniref:NADP-binding protein n=1 Tax=Dacryopinax primogenitus (strain DJM 731) TaxID=1858805 RepID=M5G6C2_DACPD|nr:NADP-binding protein [Dacryopinax primogenitus]EJU01377.1 NADP-binding protein [Dacryopinax primogenitus]